MGEHDDCAICIESGRRAAARDLVFVLGLPSCEVCGRDIADDAVVTVDDQLVHPLCAPSVTVGFAPRYGSTLGLDFFGDCETCGVYRRFATKDEADAYQGSHRCGGGAQVAS